MNRDALTPEKLREAYQHVWFVVARSQDILTPQSATLLDTNLVVFRDSTGAARVTDRRCIHRGANLADGKVVGDNIQCPYHGWQFDGSTGACARIPSLPADGRIPPKAAIKSYPVIERFGHVWTCLGDPVFDLPDPPEIADLDLDWRSAEPIHADCGFMAATENFRDMAHFPFVHEPSMGEVNPVVTDLEVKRDGREVWASYYYEQVPSAEFSAVGDAWMHYHSYAPGIATILYDFGPETGKRYLVDFPSPVSYDKCIIFWGVATDRDFKGGTADEILAVETMVFNEDTPVLEGLEPKEVPLAGQAFEVSAPADIYTLNYRRATQYAVQTIQQARGLAEVPAGNGHVHA
ncbi:aromatic ring-hydroxylating dioxygenase subunit alpha [Mycolicibacterium sp. F2034L]|uniref:aromatic ring-hydroxylating oxygenase subunit alpha n=1 Tax=Mycolicibacterium sp. F2034L TaxID=2926422 RepID=UPI001FF42135|nr:aromatic ring-hydroxylating dioxygenase subunit alpha [Mycolicibacterium sp. F2034L]MCK0175390.1 aromatic ring-hydroxylating dioxygenase subunit alpha [Mycolicibacterium sp. F2034L]